MFVYVCVCVHTHTQDEHVYHMLMHTLLLYLKTLTLFQTQEKHMHRIYATVGEFMYITYTVIHSLSLIHTHKQQTYIRVENKKFRYISQSLRVEASFVGTSSLIV